MPALWTGWPIWKQILFLPSQGTSQTLRKYYLALCKGLAHLQLSIMVTLGRHWPMQTKYYAGPCKVLAHDSGNILCALTRFWSISTKYYYTLKTTWPAIQKNIILGQLRTWPICSKTSMESLQESGM
jgi:hypothetical protein